MCVLTKPQTCSRTQLSSDQYWNYGTSLKIVFGVPTNSVVGLLCLVEQDWMLDLEVEELENKVLRHINLGLSRM